VYDELTRCLEKQAEVRKASFGLLSNYIRKTAPPKAYQDGLKRVFFEVGRFGTPLVLGYGAGNALGLWGNKAQPAPVQMQQYVNSIDVGAAPTNIRELRGTISKVMGLSPAVKGPYGSRTKRLNWRSLSPKGGWIAP